MSELVTNSDPNGNFSDGVEQGLLSDSLSLPPSRDDSLNLDISTNLLPTESPVRSVQNREERSDSLLDVSSDFLPAESPHKNSSRYDVDDGSRGAEDVEQMILEVGKIEDHDPSASPRQLEDFKTAISNRDDIIKRLSSSLQIVYSERIEDGQITTKLEEEMQSLRLQVKQALEKAAKNKSYRTRYAQLEKEREDLNARLNVASAQLQMKADSLREKDLQVEGLRSELSISTQSVADLSTNLKVQGSEINSLRSEVDGLNRVNSDLLLNSHGELTTLKEKHQEELDIQETKHKKELEDLEERYEKELEQLTNRYEEEQVVEFNLLDAELLSVREERNNLRERLEQLEPRDSEVLELRRLQREQMGLLEKAEQERVLLVEKLSSLERMYSDETEARMSLEQNLAQVSCLLDETQYNVIPQKMRESIERSLRLSEHFSRHVRLSPGRESGNLTRKDKEFVSPCNITQLESDEEISSRSTDTETTPVHRPLQGLVDESNVISSLKAEHEREMSELRKYFENYCLQLERRYRNEFEEHLSHHRHLSSGHGNITLSLEISNGQLDYSELESISPRSLDSSQLNSLGYQGPLSGQESDGNPGRSRHGSGTALDSRLNRNTQPSTSRVQMDSPRTESCSSIRPSPQKVEGCGSVGAEQCADAGNSHISDSTATQPSSRKIKEGVDEHHLEEEILRLQERIRCLEEQERIRSLEEQELIRSGGGCTQCTQLREARELTRSQHEQEITRLKSEHREEISKVREKTRQDLNSDQLRKFEAVSKQIQLVQRTEMDKLRNAMQTEHTREVDRIRQEHDSVLQEVREAHALELEELRRYFRLHYQQHEHNDSTNSIDSEVVKTLEQDLKKMTEERRKLSSMQDLMKKLITDLATHYSLSEKQVRFLSDSTFFDSYIEAKGLDSSEHRASNQLHTPFQYFIKEGKKIEEEEEEDEEEVCSERSALRDKEPQGFTPNQSVLSMEELSDLMANGTFLSVLENSEEVFTELRRQVKRSNEVLQNLEPGSLITKLSGLLTPPEGQELNRPASAVNFVGLEAGRLEVEKARLELELAAARQRIQELELTGRISLGRSEVISGLGGDLTGEASLSASFDIKMFQDLQERAACILSEAEGVKHSEQEREVFQVLGDLLISSEQLGSSTRLVVEDLSQQLEAADKQLRSTRLFLEEQAQEREAEREEWENKLTLAQAQSIRYSAEEKYEEDEPKDGEADDLSLQSKDEEKRELSAAVDKIFQLREIIKSLEGEAERRTAEWRDKCTEAEELRQVLTESLLTQQAVQEELEVLRKTSTDKEMLELIEGLKEQLNNKSQELMNHKAAHQHLHDLKAHLRGLLERVVQSTKVLNSTVGGSVSCGSSRGSSPLNILHNGVSFEDIGAGGAGLELEEVSKLERKLQILEKAEASAVHKIKTMEAEILELKLQVESLAQERDRLSCRMESMSGKQSKMETKLLNIKQQKQQLEKDFKELINHNFDDLQAENRVLQERVVSLQVQVSTLQGEREANKHRLPSRPDGLELILQEKEKVMLELDKCKARLKALETEKEVLQQRSSSLLLRVEELTEELDARDSVEHQDVESVQRLRRDMAELEEVNGKLLKELSQARAAELAAHKVMMPRLADDLLREKNCEIDGLRHQLLELTGLCQTKGYKQSTSLASSCSKPSFERLREAPCILTNLPELSLVMGGKERLVENYENSINRLDPIIESIHSSQGSRDDTNNSKTSVVSYEGRVTSSEPRYSQSQTENELSETQSRTSDISAPGVNLTRDGAGDSMKESSSSSAWKQGEIELEEYKALLLQKSEEIESLSAAVRAKEEEVFQLQDRLQDSVDRGAGLEDEISTMRRQLDESSRAIEGLNNEIHTKDEALCNLNDRLQQQQDKVRTLENNVLQRVEPSLAEEVKRLREELGDRVAGMENLHSIIQSNESQIQEQRQSYETLKVKCSVNEHELVRLNECVSSLKSENLRFKTELEAQQSELETVRSAKLKLESELARVTKEMSSVETVVKEMTAQFKKEVQARDLELEHVKHKLNVAQSHERELKESCDRLEILNQDILNKLHLAQTDLETTNKLLLQERSSRRTAEDAPDSAEVGSLDDLTNLVQRELDISSELDQTLLNQLVSGNSSLNTTQGGASEVQRLVKKVQQDGIRVLSLSERLFLTQHANEENTRHLGDDVRYREAQRKLELVQFEIDQERIVNEDLRRGIDIEKKSSLDLMTKLAKERKQRSELEEELMLAHRQLRLSTKEKSQVLPSPGDSDNEEFLNTIEAQKRQIESLEESLRIERENFSQLQNVLSVERRRGRQEESAAQDRRNEEDITELRNQLRSERSYREQLESRLGGGKSGEVAKLIIGRLHAELDRERRKIRELTIDLERERKKYFDVYQEYKYHKSGTVVSCACTAEGLDDSWNRVWRSRELELERLIADLELRVELMEREDSKHRERIETLQIELHEEREGNKSGLTKEQLERMKQVNSFLEHNLKENGEMLATICRLQEERNELRSRLSELHSRLQACSCTAGQEGKVDYYSKFLRAESYRKALIWQKRYLLSHISGGYFDRNPVLKVGRQQLAGVSRFRAAVHALISIHRIKFLVQRWRTGKRSSSVAAGRPRSGSSACSAFSESSLQPRRPETLLLESPLGPAAFSPRLPEDRTRVRRSSSLRERPPGRGNESPGSMSSSSSIFHPPGMTGRTPPTRDVAGRRWVRTSDPGYPDTHYQTRRSLGNQFQREHVDLKDPELVADLKDYLEKFHNLEKQLGYKF